MKNRVSALVLLAALATSVLAHDDRPPRYRVHEIPAVELADPDCVPGYATAQFAADFNNRRFLAGGAGCYHQQGVGSDGRPFYQLVYKPHAWSPLTGAYLLPQNPGFDALPLGVDVHNNAYGFQGSGGLDGVMWPVGGGLSVVIGADPLCGFGVSLAIDANARGEIVGWAFRPDPVLGFCNIRTVVRRPSGEEVQGPFNGSPAQITFDGTVSGAIDSQAALWNWRSGEIVNLHQATGAETSTAYDLNERGVAVGVATILESGGQPICSRSTPLTWDARHRERVLPKPPGSVSATALGLNEDGAMVGYSSSAVCRNAATEADRAVIWTDGRVTDLNRQLVGRPAVVLLQATTINERGDIIASGYRANEAKKPCPQSVIPDDGGLPYTDDSTCHDTHAYLLIPVD